MSGAKEMMRPVAGPQCRGRKPPTGQAIFTGIGGDGLRLAPCSHRARPTGTGGGPPGIPKKITIMEKRPLSTRLRKTLRRNWGARVSSACSAHRQGRFAAAAAAPSSRRCGWITVFITAKQSEQEESVG